MVKKIFFIILTGIVCCNVCFCEIAFAKNGKAKVYDIEKGTTEITSFTYSDNETDEFLPPSEGTGESMSSAQKVVIFHRADGTTVTKKADSNGKVTLPAIRNQVGYTFLGWSTKPNQSQNPQYQAGQVIQIKKATHLYTVMYSWKNEPDIQVGNLDNQLSAYSRIIFVGDSRTYFMQKTLIQEYGSNAILNVSFVCKTGQGLNWFKTTGDKLLRKEIARCQSGGENKPVAVIFNLGVNDLSDHNTGNGVEYKGVANEYISYMNSLAEQLSESNCKLFYMSVNPVNTAMKPTRKEAQLRYFNDKLQSGLNGRFQWIDTYKYLMKNGYSTYNAFKENIDDGVHYSRLTYKRIYKYCLNIIKR